MPNPKITILDGGMSRELIRLQAPFRQPEWSALSLMQSPTHVRQVHSSFALAGASILTTNSYALVPFHIGEARFREQGKELAARAGQLAREVADQVGNGVRVAGCLPPVFGSYEPARFEKDRVGEYLAVLVEGLSPFVDFWLGETLSLIEEGEAVLKAVEGTEKPVWMSFCPDDEDPLGLESPMLRSGESIEQVVEWACKADVEAVLFNCCRPEYMTSAIREAGQVLADRGGEVPILGAYANAFLPRSNDYAANENIAVVDEELDEERYAGEAKVWVESGARIVGGCCGIGSSHIAHLAKTYQAL